MRRQTGAGDGLRTDRVETLIPAALEEVAVCHARDHLETAGIAVDAVGAIPVDGYSQTITPSIYAVGDVTNRANLTPVAIREGHAFADTVFGGMPVTAWTRS
jgi:hypothetical protein